MRRRLRLRQIDIQRRMAAESNVHTAKTSLEARETEARQTVSLIGSEDETGEIERVMIDKFDGRSATRS
jgi:hypothetical protein